MRYQVADTDYQSGRNAFAIGNHYLCSGAESEEFMRGWWDAKNGVDCDHLYTKVVGSNGSLIETGWECKHCKNWVLLPIPENGEKFDPYEK